MEKTAAHILWERSEAKWNMRYTKMLSDGDASTFDHLCQLDLYDGEPIAKVECVNHIAKRLGTALRELVQKEKAKGVTLGGRKEGSLKDTTITKLTSYYRNAVVDNLPNIDLMQRRIMATVDHCASTDKNPNHQNFPEGPESWCFFNKAEALEEEPKSHADMSLKLSSLVASKVRPIYERLSKPHLLERCSRGGTQNSNKSLHSLLWRKFSKEIFASRARIEVAAVQAASEFNMGHTAALQMRRGEKGVSSTARARAERDVRRQAQSSHQKARTAKRAKNKLQRAVASKKSWREKDYKPEGH